MKKVQFYRNLLFTKYINKKQSKNLKNHDRYLTDFDFSDKIPKKQFRRSVLKYIKQFLIIISISFAGELLNHFVPLPVPAGIYGIIILFLCLNFKIIKLEDVKETGNFLVQIMPVMFIPSAVGVLESWELIKPTFAKYIIITVLTTFIVMIISRKVTQFLLKKFKKDGKTDE